MRGHLIPIIRAIYKKLKKDKNVSDECTNCKDGGYDSRFNVLLRRGNEYLEKRYYNNAIEDFAEILKNDPDNIDILFKRGYAYAEKGDYDAAIEDYDTALGFDPNNLKILQWRGYACNKRNVDAVSADHIVTPKIEIGDIIPFGKYDWRVLDVQNDKALIITKGIINRMAFHSQGKNTWNGCDVQKYLNGQFYESFSHNEQACILINQNTNDKIFLLSIGEVERLFPNQADRVAFEYDGKPHWWWLRSPSTRFEFAIARVCHDGKKGFEEGKPVNHRRGGVRPALWLNLHLYFK